jgi:hypothetical protein
MPKHPGRTGRPPKPELAAEPLQRVSVDLPRSLHTRFKLACVANGLHMREELRKLTEKRVRELEARK